MPSRHWFSPPLLAALRDGKTVRIKAGARHRFIGIWGVVFPQRSKGIHPTRQSYHSGARRSHPECASEGRDRSGVSQEVRDDLGSEVCQGSRQPEVPGDDDRVTPGARQRPNKRLKLPGLLLKESAVASPGAPRRGGPVPCARQHVARSLSAIR